MAIAVVAVMLVGVTWALVHRARTRAHPLDPDTFRRALDAIAPDRDQRER